jgi:hypothetical protein
MEAPSAVGAAAPASIQFEVVGALPAPEAMFGGSADRVTSAWEQRWLARQGIGAPAMPPQAAPRGDGTEMRAQPDPAGFDAIRSPTEPRRGTLRLSPGGTPQRGQVNPDAQPGPWSLAPRFVGGVVRDVAQNVVSTGIDVINAATQNTPQARLGLTNTPRLPQVRLAEPVQLRSQGEVESALRGMAAYLTTFAATGGFRAGASLLGRVTSGAAADFMQDPEDGTIITLLRELEVGRDLLSPLDAREAAQAENRIRARLLSMGEGAVLGGAVEGVVASLRAIRNNPATRDVLMRALAVGTVATAMAPGEAEGSLLRRAAQAAGAVARAADGPGQSTTGAASSGGVGAGRIAASARPAKAQGTARTVPAMTDAGLARVALEPAGLRSVPGLRAFHGSPHDFDRFDLSKIGTGEGGQAYGWGLYFAEAEDVARSYRDGLVRGFYLVDGARVGEHGALHRASPEALAAARLIDFVPESGRVTPSAVRKAVAEWDNVRARNPGYLTESEYQRVRDAIEGLQGRRVGFTAEGRMYEVALRVDPSRLLDWDAPLSQQPQAVQDAFGRVAPGTLEWWRGVSGKAGDSGAFAYGDLAEQLTGRHRGGAAQATQALRDAGIQGIRYLDGGSRAGGDGTRNFVIFDDGLIEIVRKYGVGPFIITGLFAAQEGDE